MNDDWLAQVLAKLRTNHPSMADQALIAAVEAQLHQQEERRQRAEDELDGRAWSKRNW